MIQFVKYITLAGMVGLSSLAMADDAGQMTQEDYQAAIEKFGVDRETARAAAEQAVIYMKSTQADKPDEAMVRLPEDFLEGSPY